MRRVVACGIVVALLFPGISSAADQTKHPLKAFIEENASSPDRVSNVQSSTAKRWGKVVLGGVIGGVLGYGHARVTGGDVAKEIAIGAMAGGVVRSR